MKYRNTNNHYKQYKESLINLVTSSTPTSGVVINHGISCMKGELYSYYLKQFKENRKCFVKPIYYNPLTIDTNKSAMNVLVTSGILLHANIFNGRTYLTLRQFNSRDGFEIKFVIDKEILLDDYLGSLCLVVGYLLPKPLGSYGLLVSACCELLKIRDTIVYNIANN